MIAAVLYGGLLCAGVALLKGPIEGDLARGAEVALGEVGGAELAVRFVGRDALLAGTVEEPGQIAAAVALVAELPGVRVVENRIVLRSAPEGEAEVASFAVEALGGGRWAMEGQVADAALAGRLEGALRAALGEGAEIEGRLLVDADTAPAPWAGAVESWMGGYLGRGSVGAGFAIFGGEILLVGDVGSEVRREEVLRVAREGFAGCALMVGDELRLVVPAERAEIAIVASRAGGFALHGRLRDPVLRGRLVELLREQGDGGGVEQQVAVGDHVAAAAWGHALVQVIPGLVTEVGALQVAVSDGEFLMAGEVRSEMTRRALAEMAGQAFEGLGMALDNQLIVVAPLQPASLSIARSADGAIRLDGRLAEPLAAGAFVEAAQPFCGPGDELVLAIGYGGRVEAAPWVDKMAGLVPAFVGAVRWGALSVHGDQVALEAEVVDAERGDVLQALVERAFPRDAFKRVIEIRVAAPEEPSAEQVMALEEAVLGTVIYFGDTGSDLRRVEREKLEHLVIALAAVPGASLALLGNTADRAGEHHARELCRVVREALEGMGVERLLLEIEPRAADGARAARAAADAGRDGGYQSAARVEFELR